MQIVIEIPEYVYEHLKESVEDSHDESIAIDAIIHGTVLLKNHGRLVDADELEKDMINGIKAANLEDGYEMYCNINNMGDCIDAVKYATTIIESDCKGED